MAEGKTAKKGTYRSNSAAFLAAQPAQDPFGCYKPKKTALDCFTGNYLWRQWLLDVKIPSGLKLR